MGMAVRVHEGAGRYSGMEAMVCISWRQEKRKSNGKFWLRGQLLQCGESLGKSFSRCFKDESASKAGSLEKRWYVILSNRLNKSLGNDTRHFQWPVVLSQITQLRHVAKSIFKSFRCVRKQITLSLSGKRGNFRTFPRGKELVPKYLRKDFWGERI